MTDHFAIFNDDPLAEVFNAPAAVAVTPPASYKPRSFDEPCVKCRGRGRFISYSGRDCGPCFACNGAGKKSFRTSPAQRADQQAARDRRAGEKTRELAQQAATFIEAHKAEVEWLTKAATRNTERGGTFDFPQKLVEAIVKFGSLTEGQLGAVRKLMARDAERAEARKTSQANAKAIDVSKIAEAFSHYRGEAAEAGEGVKWTSLLLDTFRFTDAPARGQWAAAVLVKEGDKKLGRIQDGKFIRSFACDDATEARVIAAAADPAAAAIAFGQRTGVCSCCGAELTNAESRARGIGPICAERWFGM